MTRFGNRKLQLIILLVLVSLVGTMSIAYAILSTTLNINGTAQVQDASWNVHFDNIQVNPGSVEINPVITDNNKVSFSADLTTPGEFYKFSVDIVNEGSIDAMIESIVRTPELTTEQKKYLRYEVEYVDGASINDSQLLKSSETKTISVLFSYRNDIPVSDLPTTETEFDLEIVLVYVQATSIGTDVPVGEEKLVRVVNGDINTVGSEICIGEECFHLVKISENKAILLTKYNLYVGGDSDGSSTFSYGEEATGIQHPDMRGYVSEGELRRGVDILFETYYWRNSGIKYPAYVYNEQCRFYNYVENYKTYLEGLGVVIERARLISYEELVELGCNVSESSCAGYASEWVYYTSYWTGTAYNGNGLVWEVFSNGNFKTNTAKRIAGVRPVIEISLLYF